MLKMESMYNFCICFKLGTLYISCVFIPFILTSVVHQVPQFILDDYLERGMGTECRIFCTQPRRISAVSDSERVAAERAEKLGHSTGYMIRLEQ